jgi:hypothetical protein
MWWDVEIRFKMDASKYKEFGKWQTTAPANPRLKSCIFTLAKAVIRGMSRELSVAAWRYHLLL